MNKSDLVSVMIGLFAREMIQYHFVIQNGAVCIAVPLIKVGAEIERFQRKSISSSFVSE